MATIEQLATEAADSTLEAVLCGEVVQVLPMRKWKSSAIRALKNGDFDIWAEKCITDGRAIWDRLDPDVEQIEEFMSSVTDGTGLDPKG